MVSQNDVARRAGVSNAVVSYVVNNGPRGTTKETREKVLKAIKELGYRKNNVARSLKTNTSNVIGLIIPDSSNAFFSEVAKGIEYEVYKQGYTLMFGNSGASIVRQGNYIETLISQLVDGIILLTTPFPKKHQSLIQNYNIPVVVIDPELSFQDRELKDIFVVSVDNRKGGILAGNYLVSKGHKNMAVIAGAEKVPPATFRVDGFQSSINRAGIDCQVVWAGDHPEDGYRAATKLLSSSNPPTALFACNDLLALGVLRAACDLNIKVPDQLAVIGFDDIDVANYSCPRLTTIRQPKYEMGQIAAEILINRIKSGNLGNDDENALTSRANSEILNTELIIRESA